MGEKKKIVIIGGGFAGLWAVRRLRKAPVDITLIDRSNHHLFQPLLYQVATAGLDSDDIAYPARGIFHRQPNVDVVMGRVTGADLEAHEVHLDGMGSLGYDTLVIAAGAVTDAHRIDDLGHEHHPVPGISSTAAALDHMDESLDLVVRTHDLQLHDGEVPVAVYQSGAVWLERIRFIAVADGMNLDD